MRAAARLAPVLLLGGVALSGCLSAPRAAVLTPTEQYGIELTQGLDSVQLAARGPSLSPTQIYALEQLAARWRNTNGAPIRIDAPGGSANAGAASQIAAGASRVLIANGVPQPMLQMGGYDADGRPDATVVVGFSRLMTVVPDCAGRQGELGATFNNEPSPGFGCAVTANVAALIAEPNDLLTPRDMTPSDALRRDKVLDTYRAGQPTGTPRTNNPNETANVKSGS